MNSTPINSSLFNNKENLEFGVFTLEDLQHFIEKYITERNLVFPHIDRLFQHLSINWRLLAHNQVVLTFPNLTKNRRELAIKEIKDNKQTFFNTQNRDFFTCEQSVSFNIHPLIYPFDIERYIENANVVLARITFTWKGTYYYNSERLESNLTINKIEESPNISYKFQEAIFRALSRDGEIYEDSRRINEVTKEFVSQSRSSSDPVEPSSKKKKSGKVFFSTFH